MAESRNAIIAVCELVVRSLYDFALEGGRPAVAAGGENPVGRFLRGGLQQTRRVFSFNS
jgi:hypothetical protein